MNMIEFENKQFYPLNGLQGYYATLDGEVLSTKKSPKILKHNSKTLGGAYHFSVDGKIKAITKARVIYMAQTGCSLDEIKDQYVGIKNGVAVISEKVSDVRAKKVFEPLKEISLLRTEIDLLETFYKTKNINSLKKYIESKREELEAYCIRSLMQGRLKVIQFVNESISDFYMALYECRVSRGIIQYIKGIMRKRAAVQRKERATLLHHDFLFDIDSVTSWRMA